MTTKKIAAISAELQALQKQRAWYMKSRIMVMNRLQATVANEYGYHTGMTEADRMKAFADAGKVIKRIMEGEESRIGFLVKTTMNAVEGFRQAQAGIESEMLERVKQLPVAKWAQETEQKGFGLLSLAVVIGETGDLSNYANPAKVWRRLGCAPFTKDDETRMGSTWRRVKGLSSAEWEDFGYSPRRRSIVYVVSESLMKANGDGPYKTRYDDVKADRLKDREWSACRKCEGAGRLKKVQCPNCKGKKIMPGRAHRHGMLLMIKLLLKNLWIEWNDHPPMPAVPKTRKVRKSA